MKGRKKHAFERVDSDEELYISIEAKNSPTNSHTEEFELLEIQKKPRKQSLSWKNEASIESMSEIEFLQVLKRQSDADSIQGLVDERLQMLLDTDDALRMSKMKFWKLAIYRSPAIVSTLILEMLVGLIISRYNLLLEKHILMTSFMPVLSSLSGILGLTTGNIGLQASTATLRALATGYISISNFNDISKLILKEFASASIIASLSGLCLGLVASLWSKSAIFGVATGVSAFISAAVSGVIGCLSPLIFKNLNVDPAVTAGPFETAIQDVIGMALYLSLSLLLL